MKTVLIEEDHLQTRVALLEQGRVVEVHIERDAQRSRGSASCGPYGPFARESRAETMPRFPPAQESQHEQRSAIAEKTCGKV